MASWVNHEDRDSSFSVNFFHFLILFSCVWGVSVARIGYMFSSVSRVRPDCTDSSFGVFGGVFFPLPLF